MAGTFVESARGVNGVLDATVNTWKRMEEEQIRIELVARSPKGPK